MRHLGSVVLSIIVAGVAGSVAAQGAGPAPGKPERAPAVGGPQELPPSAAPRMDGPPVRAITPVRVLEESVALKVLAVSDGRVIAGYKMPKAALDTLAKLGFARVAAAGIRPDTIHEDRLYRSYQIAKGAKITAEDFVPFEGREVRVKIQEIYAGRVYAIVDIVSP